jgi:hypothetical protein
VTRRQRIGDLFAVFDGSTVRGDGT